MGKNRILVVEDEIIIAMEIKATLKKLGYEVPGIATNGIDAIDLCRKTEPDLVLMDIRLKGDMDGIEAAEKIMGLYDTPIIFLTGNSDEEIVNRAIAINPAGFLIKPYRERELFGNIEMAIYKNKIKQSVETPKIIKTEEITDIIRYFTSPVIFLDSEGRISEVSKKAALIIGKKPEDLKGIPAQEIFIQKNSSDENSGPEKNLTYPQEIRIKTSRGIKKALLLTGFYYDRTNDKIRQFIEISDRRKYPEEKESKTEIIPDILDTIDDSVFVLTRNLKVLYTNRKFDKFADNLNAGKIQPGMPAYEIPGIKSIINPDEYVETIRTGNTYSGRRRIKTRTGFLLMEIIIYPVIKSGRVTSLIVYLRDATKKDAILNYSEEIDKNITEIEESISKITALLDKVNSPILNIINIAKGESGLKIAQIMNNASEASEALSAIQLQTVRYEDAMNTMRHMGNKTREWDEKRNR